MQFGSDKCAYLNIERGNQKWLGKFLTLDETKLAELTKGGCYKYLGQDENIGTTWEHYKDDPIEVWWDTKIKTLQNIQYNRPDIVVWKIKEKLCFIIDVSIGLDVNVKIMNSNIVAIYL